MNNTEITESCFGSHTSHTSKLIYNEGKVITAVISLYLSIPLSILATTGNGLILYAIFTTNALQRPSTLLLAFIAITDFLAGILPIPASIAIRIMEARTALIPCPLRLAYRYILGPLTTVSFLMIGSLNVDMLLAAFFPLKYNTWQLKKIYAWIFATFWFLPISLQVLMLSKIIETDTARKCVSVVLFFAVICIVLSLLGIYKIIRRSDASVGDLLSHSAVEHRRKTQKRKLKTLVVVTLFFIVCHLPNAIVLQFEINEDSSVFYHAFRYSAILAFLNSSLNPIIFCYRNVDIRRVVLETLFTVTSRIRKGARIILVKPKI